MKLTNITATNTYPTGSEHDPKVIFSALVDLEDGSDPFTESVEAWQSHLTSLGEEKNQIEFLVAELKRKIAARGTDFKLPFTELQV